MRSSFRAFIAAALVALTVFFSTKESQAYEYNAVYDPVTWVETGRSSTPNHNGFRGDVDRIYMNRNQLLIRITGCEFGARVTSTYNVWDDGYCDDGAGNPRHWTGSGMEFIESLVNDKLLGATTNPVELCSELDQNGVCGGTAAGDITIPPQYWRVASGNDTNSGLGIYYDYNDAGATGTQAARFTATNADQEPIFRNYLDLLVKRLLDGDLTTPLDYDTYTFRYVDTYNPAFTVPTFLGINVSPTTTDTNGDGIEGGWEPDLGDLIAPFCLPDLIVIGPEVCFNLNIVNLDETLLFTPNGPWGAAVTDPGNVREINNVGAPMLDYDRYLRTDQAGTSHLFLASQPKRDFTFDSEIEGCTSSLISTPGNCNESAYRDDDDGLYIELQLINFQLDLLFEPPFTDSAYGVSSEVWGTGTGRSRHVGLNSGAFADTMTGSVMDIPSTGDYNGRTSWPCPGRANDDVAFVNNVTNEEADTYVAACDLSRWLKIYGPVRIPELRLGLSVRLELSYNEGLDYTGAHYPNLPPSLSPSNVTGPVIGFGFDLEFIEFAGQFAYQLLPGPFCNNGESRQGQDYRGLFYDQTDVPKNCEPRNWQPGTPSIFDDSTYDKSVQFASTITFVRAEFLGEFEDFFDPTTNPGFYLGPTVIPGLNDLNDVVGEINFDWPLAGTTPQNQTDAVWIQLGLEGDVEVYDDMIAPLASPLTYYEPFNSTGGNQDLETGNGDQTNEFWADPWGVAMPIAGGVGFYWADATGGASQDEVVSCVKADGGFTGYEDGYQSLAGGSAAAIASRADDPSVSRPLPNLSLNWAGSAQIAGMGGSYDSAATGVPGVAGPEYDSMLLHLRIPNVSGKPPFVTAATLKGTGAFDDDLVPSPSAMVTQETYAFGIAIHQNLLSKVIYEFVIDGLLCMDINPDAAYEDTLDGLLGGLLTTDTLGLFVPYLSEHFGGYNMSLRILPLLRQPTIAGQNFLPTARSTGDGYSSTISQFVRDFTNGGTIGYGNTDANDIPRIIIGGANQFDSLKKRFRGQIATDSLIEYTCGITTANPLTSPTCGIWPDLSIIIPHLLVEFFINDDGPNHDQAVVRRRAFAMDLGINVGLNIDVIQNPIGGTLNDPNASGLFGDAIPNSRPIYGGTNFPIGCDALGTINTNFPCDTTGVPSRLVIFLGGLLDPEINSILVYDELPGTITDFTGAVENVSTCIDPMGGTSACSRPTDVDAIASYQAAISNLLGLILSGEISFFAEIGFDPAAYIDLPVVVTIPYIGPSFVVNDDSEPASTSGQGVISAGGNLVDNLGCYRDVGIGNCPDPVFFNGDVASGEIVRDVSDGDANGFGDYLVVALGLDLQYLESRFLLRLLDSFVEPLLNDYCDGDLDGDDNATTWGGSNPVTDVVCTSESFNSRLTEILASLGIDLAPGFAPESEGRLPVGYQSPETVIKGVRKAHGFETIVEYEGWHPTAQPSELTFSYRVDGGFWTPFVPATTARIPGLFEGRHVFEVRAKDPRNNVEYTPERIEFVVDSVAPRVAILGDRVQNGGAEFLVEVYDAQSLPEDVRVAYKLNDGEWSGYSYDKEIAFSAPTGQHVLRVRAMDESGNIGEQTLTIAVEDGGFGCASTTAGGDGVLDLLLILLVPALVVRARRRIA